MKHTPVLLLSRYLINGSSPANGRKLAKYPFPYNGVIPLALRNEVSTKGKLDKKAPCQTEISELLTCLSKNDFKETLCLKKAADVRSCEENFMKSYRMKKEQEKKGILVPGARSLSNAQLNVLLKKYPQPSTKS